MTYVSPDDPYRDRKKYHKARLVSTAGGVSALCFERPRAINLEHARWTLLDEAVTCPKCLRILKKEKNER